MFDVQGSCTSVLPEGATHLPELTATTVNVLAAPVARNRNCWLVPEWHAYWITAALSAVDAPKTSRQLPEVNVPTLWTSPDTGVNVNDWPAPEPHAARVSCTALFGLGTVAQLPSPALTIVLVNVVAALAGTAPRTPPPAL